MENLCRWFDEEHFDLFVYVPLVIIVKYTEQRQAFFFVSLEIYRVCRDLGLCIQNESISRMKTKA